MRTGFLRGMQMTKKVTVAVKVDLKVDLAKCLKFILDLISLLIDT